MKQRNKKMKALREIVLISLIFYMPGISLAQNKNKLTKQLSLNFNALLHDTLNKNYSITIYFEGTKKDSIFINDIKPVQLNFEYEKTYCLLFNKDGFKNKIIIVNTKIPKGIKKLNKGINEFEIEMSEDIVKKSKQIEDLPVAILMIDKDKKYFTVNEEYHDYTHNKPYLNKLKKTKNKKQHFKNIKIN